MPTFSHPRSFLFPALWTRSGAYDRRAIMRAAVGQARVAFGGNGLTWSQRMSLGLKAAWQAAREQARVGSFLRPTVVATAPNTPRRRFTSSPYPARAFVSGSRAYAHGW